MIDLHTHSILSDGELLPTELAHRAEVAGYEAIAITDHVDASNMDTIIAQLLKVSNELKGSVKIKIIPGIEITHVPPSQIGTMVREARALGAKIIVAHGESIVEPVARGTNRAAIKACVDILAHPGLIKESDVKLASENSVMLEITSRRGHSITNGHVASMAKRFNAKMVLNTDSHSPSDLISEFVAKEVVLGAGLNSSDYKLLKKHSKELLRKAYS
jgi:histidinol phosphatase-like PHP family hydrolase